MSSIGPPAGSEGVPRQLPPKPSLRPRRDEGPISPLSLDMANTVSLHGESSGGLAPTVPGQSKQYNDTYHQEHHDDAYPEADRFESPYMRGRTRHTQYPTSYMRSTLRRDSSSSSSYSRSEQQQPQRFSHYPGNNLSTSGTQAVGYEASPRDARSALESPIGETSGYLPSIQAVLDANINRQRISHTNQTSSASPALLARPSSYQQLSSAATWHHLNPASDAQVGSPREGPRIAANNREKTSINSLLNGRPPAPQSLLLSSPPQSEKQPDVRPPRHPLPTSKPRSASHGTHPEAPKAGTTMQPPAPATSKSPKSARPLSKRSSKGPEKRRRAPSTAPSSSSSRVPSQALVPPQVPAPGLPAAPAPGPSSLKQEVPHKKTANAVARYNDLEGELGMANPKGDCENCAKSPSKRGKCRIPKEQGAGMPKACNHCSKGKLKCKQPGEEDSASSSRARGKRPRQPTPVDPDETEVEDAAEEADVQQEDPQESRQWPDWSRVETNGVRKFRKRSQPDGDEEDAPNAA